MIGTKEMKNTNSTTTDGTSGTTTGCERDDMVPISLIFEACFHEDRKSQTK